MKIENRIHNTLITTYGLKYNEYSSDFDSVITLDEFKQSMGRFR